MKALLEGWASQTADRNWNLTLFDEMATRDKKLTDARVEAALLKHAGLVSCAARELGVSRQAIHYRMLQSDHLRTVCCEAREEVLDYCESAIIAAIKSGDVKTSQWYLDRVGRMRGYGTKPDASLDLDAMEGFTRALVVSLGGDVEKLRAAAEVIRQGRVLSDPQYHRQLPPP